MKGVASAVIGLAVAAAAGLGTFNLVTTGCPLGSCETEVESSSAALPVALDEGEAKGSCCPLGGEAEGAESVMLVGLESGETCSAEKMAACSEASEGCSAEKMAACMESAEGCTAEKIAACQGEQASEAVVIAAAMPAEGESCAEMEGCCKADGCVAGGGCCKDVAGDE